MKRIRLLVLVKQEYERVLGRDAIGSRYDYKTQKQLFEKKLFNSYEELENYKYHMYGDDGYFIFDIEEIEMPA